MVSRLMLCLLVAFLAIDCLHGDKAGKRATAGVMKNKELTEAVLELQGRMDDCEARVNAFEQNARAPLTSCPSDWVSYQSSCYGVGAEQVTWAEAQEFCRVYGGHLAEVDDSEENTFIKDLLRSKGVDVWLGGTDIIVDGEWVWASNGQAFGFKDFDVGQESQNSGGSPESCIVAPGFSDYKWHDYPCTDQKYFICEVRLA